MEVRADIAATRAPVSAIELIEFSATSYRDTGLASNGERFEKIEVQSTLGGDTKYAYVTGSGKRYIFPPGE